MLQLNREARACSLKWGENAEDNSQGTWLLRIKASPQKRGRSLLYIYIKPGPGFFVGSTEAVPIYTTSKEFIKCLSHQHIAPGFEHLFTWKIIILLIQLGTFFNTGCEMLVAPALFPTVFPAVWEGTGVCLAVMGKDLRPKVELFNSAVLWDQGSAAPQSKGLLLLPPWVACAKLSQVRWIICTEFWLILCLFQFAREQGTNCNSSLKITSA